MKKIGIMLCVCIALFAALAGKAEAADAPLTKEQAIVNEAKRVYNACRYTAGRSSFAGWCGLMTSHQLYNMGINETLIVNDGNRQFDYYKDLEKTSAGYYINVYSAMDYTLEEALNALTKEGTQDAYNILVGFQWTNTEAGHRYGHACVINAIVDGTVYFTESFYTSIAGPEGNVGRCSISRFAQLFYDWTSFEGIIHFGTAQYADSCDSYPTNVYVRTRFDSMLRTQPCLLGENGCKKMRSLTSGELLLASAVYADPQSGMLYYRIEDGEGQGYVAAGAVSLVQYNEDNLKVSNIQTEAFIKSGKSLAISGNITAKGGMINSVEVVISDPQGNVVQQQHYPLEKYHCDFSGLNKTLAKEKLPDGFYRVQVYANVACAVANGTTVEINYVRQLLHNKISYIAKVPKNVRVFLADTAYTPVMQQDGWTLENGKWHYYRQGQPVSGWFEDLGVRYYLKEDGAVTTGWAEIDGAKWYFSPTGALCHGWLATKDGTVYLQNSGGMAMGWQTIEGYKYFFESNNLLLTEGTKKENGVRYKIQWDGKAIPTK